MRRIISKKALIVSILIPLAIGALAGFFIRGSVDVYRFLNKPPLAPAPFVFPIVWTILYILMGISCYLIVVSRSRERSTALGIYTIQLVVNFLWPLFFFNVQAYLFSFLLLAALWLLCAAMIVTFRRINYTASQLLIPYLLWISFAGYLNLGIYFLNR